MANIGLNVTMASPVLDQPVPWGVRMSQMLVTLPRSEGWISYGVTTRLGSLIYGVTCQGFAVADGTPQLNKIFSGYFDPKKIFFR